MVYFTRRVISGLILFSDYILFGASLKGPFKVLQFLELPCWLHFSVPLSVYLGPGAKFTKHLKAKSTVAPYLLI